MSLQAGLAALNRVFTPTIPRTEYSAQYHWPLVQQVTGLDTTLPAQRAAATAAFIARWDYALLWSILVQRKFMERNGGRITKMGHAEYMERPDGQSDFNTDITNPFSDPEKALSLDPCAEYGAFDPDQLVQEMNADYAAKVARLPDTLNFGGVYITLLSGMLEIYGWDNLLLAMGMDPARFNKIFDGYFEWVTQFFTAYARSEVPQIMVHDDICWTSGPFAHPDWYRTEYFPKFRKLIAILKEAGKKVVFTSDGNWTPFFEDVVATGVDMVVMEPCADMALFAERFGDRCGFVGNADCRVLLSGSRAEIRQEVQRCLTLGRKYAGFILAVGNHIPPNTPVDNALYYNEVYEQEKHR